MNERKPSEKLEARRLKRNQYSRDWKKAHKTKVRAWNKAWALEQTGNKEAADKLRAAVRNKPANDQASAEQKPSADVKEAVTTAAKYLRVLLGEIGGLRLEEIEQQKNGAGWLVTFSFTPTPAASSQDFFIKREYKQVEIDASGEPVAMRIRTFE